jgi:two-component system, chemotaxis family, response regulator Rcp1
MEVLLVEDNIGDVRLAQEAFGASKRSVNMHVARDGLAAMCFLRKEGAHIHVPRPNLILLDLNLPKMGGREVLLEIKRDDSLKSIPTIILSSSEVDADSIISYKHCANCYVTKPKDYDTFVHIVRAIETLWFGLTLEPDSSDSAGVMAASARIST